MSNEVNWDDVVERLIKSRDFKNNLKKVLADSSTPLGTIANKKDRFVAIKKWFDNIPNHSRHNLNEVVENVAFANEDEYYVLNMKLKLSSWDHYHLMKGLVKHYVIHVNGAIYNVSAPSEQKKGNFTKRQYLFFTKLIKQIEKIEHPWGNHSNLTMSISQFNQDLLLEMIDYYLNFTEDDWYSDYQNKKYKGYLDSLLYEESLACDTHCQYEDAMCELQVLHELIENL